MRIIYDDEADALYIELKGGRAAEAVEVEEGVVVDLDAQGHIVGLEVLDAAARFGHKALSRIEVEGIPAPVEFAILPVKEGVGSGGSASLRRKETK